MTISYNLNIPAGPNNPSVDQPKMQTNTNNISQLIGIDHVTFNDAVNPNGYHTVIHQTLQASDPASIVGIGQIYSKNVTVGITTDTQLFHRTGLGGISQLTGNSALQNGYQWIGGVLLQWGRATSVGTALPNATVNFPINFSSPAFSVNCTIITTADSRFFVEIFDISNNQFRAVTRDAGGSKTGGITFAWMAVGK